MSFEILTKGTIQLILITAATFKAWKVWHVQFDDGKEAVLYKCGDEWMQRNDDHLDRDTLLTIGKCIDDNRLENMPNSPYNKKKSLAEAIS